MRGIDRLVERCRQCLSLDACEGGSSVCGIYVHTYSICTSADAALLLAKEFAAKKLTQDNSGDKESWASTTVEFARFVIRCME